MKRLYGFTQEGAAWIDGYDFRQMVEQPAWFGSHGYGSWAGAGEAAPRSVLHEMSHSYWGAFSVAGRPELSWSSAQGLEPAFAALRDDLQRFMEQPPDRFEPLRDRFRNLPGLNTGDYPDLFHFGEAELLYMTGGNLHLVPPLLRPYFSGYLEPGGIGAAGGESPESWDIALSWFNSLEGDDRRVAGEIFGLQHFPYPPYAGLPPTTLSGLEEEARTTYKGEEQQRLIDFAQQFDDILAREFSLVDASGADRGFDFWRSYLSDKLALHQRYPEVLRDTGTARGGELADALDFYADIAHEPPGEQVNRFRQAESQPLAPELAVLLQPRAIVELFSGSALDSGIRAVLGSRAVRLAALVETAESVELVTVADGPFAGAAVFEQFMRSVPEDVLRADVFLLLDLLRSADGNLAGAVLPAMSNEGLLFLLRIQPAAARSFEISPERLLTATGITAEASLEQVRTGASLLAANSSGNFAIDEPYDAAVFAHLDRFAESHPSEVLQTVLESGVRLVPWVDRESDGALRAMRLAPESAVNALASLGGSRETPWRILHLVAKDDPELAARLAVGLDGSEKAGNGSIERMVREFVYDRYWSERNAGPNVMPARFADFLSALTNEIGEAQVTKALTGAVLTTGQQVSAGEVEAGALDEFSRTAQAALDAVSGEQWDALQRMMSAAGLIE